LLIHRRDPVPGTFFTAQYSVYLFQPDTGGFIFISQPMPFRCLCVLLLLFSLSSCRKKQEDVSMTLSQAKAGNIVLYRDQITNNISVSSEVVLNFDFPVDPLSAVASIKLITPENTELQVGFSFSDLNKTVILKPFVPLEWYTIYKLSVSGTLKGSGGELFQGVTFQFRTAPDKLGLIQALVGGQPFQMPVRPRNVTLNQMEIVFRFSDSLDINTVSNAFTIFPPVNYNQVVSSDKKQITIQSQATLKDFTRYYITLSQNLKSWNGAPFTGFSNSFYTVLDSTPRFPMISDDQLLSLIQERTFRYFYHHAHPDCGMARERNTSGDYVTTGGSGFGIMALIVGIDRMFITRAQGLERLDKILRFLETCDRFHGAFPHWINGKTGKTIPFTVNDNGADLVETSFMIQGLITMRQYLNPVEPEEALLINRINTLCNDVEYEWFTRGQQVLYWHWSPDKGWIMNMEIRGYNETLITYVLAASSLTHPVDASVYHQGYARNGNIRNGNTYYNIRLPLGEAYGGPLFFTHYSFLGLNPRNLRDQYADYWEQNVNQSKINHAYCQENPGNHVGYSNACWGLTACDNPWGYSAHSPTNDKGVIAPTAAISALPYTPELSMNAVRFFYYQLGDHLLGDDGFYDAFCPDESWWSVETLAIDQGPMIVMIENYRTALLWNLFMSAPEVKAGLGKLGFTY
jgi:hypothetical protein